MTKLTRNNITEMIIYVPQMHTTVCSWRWLFIMYYLRDSNLEIHVLCHTSISPPPPHTPKACFHAKLVVITDGLAKYVSKLKDTLLVMLLGRAAASYPWTFDLLVIFWWCVVQRDARQTVTPGILRITPHQVSTATHLLINPQEMLRDGWLHGTVLSLWPRGCEFDLGSRQLLGERANALLLTLATHIVYSSEGLFNHQRGWTAACVVSSHTDRTDLQLTEVSLTAYCPISTENSLIIIIIIINNH